MHSSINATRYILVCALALGLLCAAALYSREAQAAESGANGEASGSAAAHDAAEATALEPENVAALPEMADAEMQAVEVAASGEERIAALEARVAELEALLSATSETAESALACCPEEESPCQCEPAIAMYGDFYVQGRYSELRGEAGGEYSDVGLYWGELGWDAGFDVWSGHFSLLFDDLEDDVLLHEAWVEWKRREDPLYVRAGRSVSAFGNNDYYFPTYPAVNDLGYSTLNGLGLGYDNGRSALGLFAYNSPVDNEEGSDTIGDYTAVWDITKQEADECRDGWRLSAGYNTNLAAHDLRLAGDAPGERVAAANIFGRYDWHGGGKELYHFIADYSWALDEFSAEALDADGEEIGDRPAALNAEFIYEPQTDMLYGLNYQLTDEMAGYAETRWGAMFGRRLNPMTMLKLEYSHGEYGAHSPGLTDDDSLVAEVNVSF